jgi:hypothetical protein
MKNPTVFVVTAIEYFEAVGDADPKKPKVHLWQNDRIGTDATSLKFEIQHELAGTKKGDDIAAFFNRLEVKVEAVNFPC